MAAPRRFTRAALPAIASVAYVAVVGFRAGARGAGAVAVTLVALLLAVRAGTLRERAEAAASWGAGLALAASLAAARPLVGMAGWLGVLVASLAAGHAIVHAASPGGLGAEHVRLHPRGPRWLLVAAWGVFPALGALSSGTRAPVETIGSMAGMHVLAIAALVLHELRTRRLELGVPERMRAVLGALFVLVIAGVTTSWTGAVIRGNTVPWVSSSIAALASLGPVAILLARRGDPARLGAISRVALVAGIAGGGLVLFLELVLIDRPHDGGALLPIVGAGALLVGALAADFSKPLRPHQGALLDAIDAARAACTRADPEEALREVLVRLREPSGPSAPSPALFMVDPPRALTVDAAGYVREREAEAHPLAIANAAREPEGVLRVEVLEALEIRRPDLRPLLAHFRDEGALCAAVVAQGSEPEALLVVPAGPRDAPMSLEEVRALHGLADQLAGLCAARGALARSMERERALSRRAEQLESALGRLEHETHLDAAREELAAGRLARPATVAMYSAASRLAYEGIERRARVGAPFVVFAPAGVDPVPYVARAHLAGPRAHAPLVIVDGTLAREHEIARWRDPATSPLALAHRGVLVLLDGAVLPEEVQSLVGNAIAEKRAPWERPEPLDVVLALTSAWDRARLEAALSPALLARLGDALDVAVTVPAIHDRAEDIRALVTDRLAREGLRLHGRPIGIEDAAFARLVDHHFDGGDAELASLVLRLAASCQGDVIRAPDIDRLALAPAPSPSKHATNPPPANVRPLRR